MRHVISTHLADAEQRDRERRLARARAACDADLLARADLCRSRARRKRKRRTRTPACRVGIPARRDGSEHQRSGRATSSPRSLEGVRPRARRPLRVAIKASTDQPDVCHVIPSLDPRAGEMTVPLEHPPPPTRRAASSLSLSLQPRGHDGYLLAVKRRDPYVPRHLESPLARSEILMYHVMSRVPSLAPTSSETPRSTRGPSR